MELKERLNESRRRTIAIVSIGVIGSVMSVLGLTETGRSATGETITGPYADPNTVPMGRTAEGIYSAHPEILTQAADTGMGIPIFNEFLPAFMYLGGITLLLAAAYIDYTEGDNNTSTTNTA